MNRYSPSIAALQVGFWGALRGESEAQDTRGGSSLLSYLSRFALAQENLLERPQ